MKQRDYALYSGVLFLVIFFAHGARIVFGWDVVVGNLVIPAWPSWVALILSGYLAHTAFKLGGHIK